ncbi:hypothetical protein FVE85_4228 [Porphyridium purpureum]|uniref:Carbohydrate binding module family 25 domain-containing protein n=1 Tax=Porphyridium purpureum TaxID=35688 RepID=A0A5J4YU12_PORPP|nr:hypothetical protein FVE85_4228 [Porphyridium purpureum]|eukprot:POR0536..scf229_5
MAAGKGWIEVFYSNETWKRAVLVYKERGSDEWKEVRMVDAGHIRKGFRVARLYVGSITFFLTNGLKNNKRVEDCWGQNFRVDIPGGRFVVQNGGALKYVGDADGQECERALSVANDRYIEVLFSADLWQSCCMVYSKNAGPFIDAPGTPLEKLPTGEFFFQTEAASLEFAFNNGGEVWDSNNEQNYIIGYPGRYKVYDGRPHFLSRADADTKGIFGGVSNGNTMSNGPKAAKRTV